MTRKEGIREKRALCAALLAALLSTAARADRAVVVGVQRYANLPPRANLLKGCVNDAKSMAQTLSKYGFRVILLLDEQATKQGILGALRKASASIKRTERFVFYFAGHGTDAPKPCLLPHDALNNTDTNHVSKIELYAAMSSIPARSRTVILDSCFSGGMSRKPGGRPGLRPRYYPCNIAGKGGARSPVPVPANGQDTYESLSGGSGGRGDVCYYTASLGNEKAMEDDFNGVAHGVFTYFLTSSLTGSEDLWGNIHTAVESKVTSYVFDWQHPTLAKAVYLKTRVFESTDSPSAAPPAEPSTLWAVYNHDYVDPTQVSLTMTPNKTSLAVEQPLSLTAIVGSEGYLVILERFVDNRVYLLFPKSRDAEDAHVRPGQAFNRRYAGDTPGTEHVKAVLYSSREKAAALLKTWPEGNEGVAFGGMGKRLHELGPSHAPFFTSEISFEIAGAAPAAQR